MSKNFVIIICEDDFTFRRHKESTLFGILYISKSNSDNSRMSGSILRPRRVATLSILSCLAFVPQAHAEEILGSGWEESVDIVGGKKVESCDFPTTFFIKASDSKGASVCTASLIHPKVIMTAAHCLNTKMEVASGDGYLGDAKKSLKWRPVKKCVKHPGWNGNTSSGRGKDLAFCELKEPVKDIKPVPVLMGCERDYLKEGTPITLVGFGNTSIGGKDAGSWKHAIDSKVVGFSEYNEVQVGARGAGSLRGDSGGPAYVKLPESKFKKDAGWRVFGVTSVSAGGGGPDGRAFYGQIHTFVEFVEKQTGIDVTPCTDAKGNWEPNENCKEAPLDPRAASGDWINGCKPAPYGGYIASCGEPFGKGKADEEAPEVEITSPEDKKEFEPDTEEVEVKVKATDNEGVTSVKLKVNGKEQKEDKEEPYEWTLEDLKPGEYKLEAIAVDAAGNEGKSEKIKFIVEEPEEEETESESGEDSETGKGSDTGDDETESGDDGTESGDDETESGDDGTESGKDDSESGDDGTESGDDGTESGDDDSESGGNGKGKGGDDGEEDKTKDPKNDGTDLNKKGSCAVTGDGSPWSAGLLGLPFLYWMRRRRS